MTHPTPSAHELVAQAAQHRAQNRFGEALACLKQAITTDPLLPEAWEQTGYILLNRKKWPEARNIMALALDSFPHSAVMRAHFALALAKCGDTAAAYAEITKALEQEPNLVEALLTRIEILCDAGYYDLANQQSQQLPSDHIPETARFCIGATAFQTGDLTYGMHLLASVLKSGYRGRDLPEWNGAAAPHEHVLLYNSQGFGDLIQFARYIPHAQQKTGKITVQVQSAMQRLMQDSFPDLAIITDAAPIPEDVTSRCSLLSLAAHGVFDACAQTPYLKADPERVAAWRARLAHLPRPWVGVVWASPWQMNNPFRVVNIDTLQPLIEAAGAHLVSLQLGEQAADAAAAGIFNAAPHIKDFADSAALISALDLLITLDSAPAHLAGALNTPAWVFLPFNAEWRWLIAREDCIWYPSMRLIRQPTPQGWDTVFAGMRRDLQQLIDSNRTVLQPQIWSGPAPRRHANAMPLPGLDAAEKAA